jgi:hypothetical protein
MSASKRRSAVEDFGFNQIQPTTSRKDTSCLYEPVNGRQIRLLSLLPGSKEESISCRLETQALEDDQLHFKALSWAWGPPGSPEKSVTVNGQKISIRKTLYEALQTLRCPGEVRVFWIDAICIDQNNDKEKERQIPLMADIYTSASSVTIWLGDSSSDIDWLIECIEADKTEAFKTVKFHIASHAIKMRSWFWRVWVIQEFALNKSDPLFLFSNGNELSWTKFSVACRQAMEVVNQSLVSNVFNKAPFDSKQVRDMKERGEVSIGGDWSRAILDTVMKNPDNDNVEKIRSRQQSSGNRWMVDCLALSKISRSTDARDRIYGILGLLPAQGRDLFARKFPIDYSKSIEEVYTDASIFMLVAEKTRSLEIYQNFRVAAVRNLRAPSWVPDFREPFLSDRNYLAPLKAETSQLSASLHITKDRHMLCVKGFFLDEIMDIISCGKHRLEVQTIQLPFAWKLLRSLTYVVQLKEEGTWNGISQISKASAQSAYNMWALSRAVADIMRLIKPLLRDHSLESVWKFLLGWTLHSFDVTEEELNSEFEKIVELGSRSKASLKEALHSSALKVSNVTNHLYRQISGQYFFVGKNGCYGLTKDEVQRGDRLLLLVFPKQHAPFILRKKGETTYEMIAMAEFSEQMHKDALARAGESLVDVHIV